jgi:hypothetical protein
MPTTTMSTSTTARTETGPSGGSSRSPLALLEASPDTSLAGFLAAMAGPVEGIELSPDYFYNWHNWSNEQ